MKLTQLLVRVFAFSHLDICMPVFSDRNLNSMKAANHESRSTSTAEKTLLSLSNFDIIVRKDVA